MNKTNAFTKEEVIFEDYDCLFTLRKTDSKDCVAIIKNESDYYLDIILIDTTSRKTLGPDDEDRTLSVAPFGTIEFKANKTDSVIVNAILHDKYRIVNFEEEVSNLKEYIKLEYNPDYSYTGDEVYIWDGYSKDNILVSLTLNKRNEYILEIGYLDIEIKAKNDNADIIFDDDGIYCKIENVNGLNKNSIIIIELNTSEYIKNFRNVMREKGKITYKKNNTNADCIKDWQRINQKELDTIVNEVFENHRFNPYSKPERYICCKKPHIFQDGTHFTLMLKYANSPRVDTLYSLNEFTNKWQFKSFCVEQLDLNGNPIKSNYDISTIDIFNFVDKLNELQNMKINIQQIKLQNELLIMIQKEKSKNITQHEKGGNK